LLLLLLLRSSPFREDDDADVGCRIEDEVVDEMEVRVVEDGLILARDEEVAVSGSGGDCGLEI
jgi:hypothetical protein